MLRRIDCEVIGRIHWVHNAWRLRHVVLVINVARGVRIPRLRASTASVLHVLIERSRFEVRNDIDRRDGDGAVDRIRTAQGSGRGTASTRRGGPAGVRAATATRASGGRSACRGTAGTRGTTLIRSPRGGATSIGGTALVRSTFGGTTSVGGATLIRSSGDGATSVGGTTLIRSSGDGAAGIGGTTLIRSSGDGAAGIGGTTLIRCTRGEATSIGGTALVRSARGGRAALRRDPSARSRSAGIWLAAHGGDSALCGISARGCCATRFRISTGGR